MTTRPIYIWAIWGIVANAFFTQQISAGEIRNGGDGLAVGAALYVLDEIERDSTFVPSATGESWEILNGQLSKIEKVMPLSARYLRRFFIGGRVFWSLAKVKLKPVNDEGSSNIMLLSKELEQLAVNQGNKVQIFEDSWNNKLSPRSKAYLMLHEALWIASGRIAFSNASKLRELVSTLMDPNLESYTTENLARLILECFDTKNREYVGLRSFVQFELENLGSFQTQWRVHEVDSASGYQISLELQETGKNPIFYTLLNPFSTPKGLRFSAKRGLFVSGKVGEPETVVDIVKLCESRTYAGKNNWKLPTLKQLHRWVSRGAAGLRHPVDPSFYQDKDLPFSSVRSYQNHFLYPFNFESKNYPLVVSNEGYVYELSPKAVFGRATVDVPVHYLCVRE